MNYYENIVVFDKYRLVRLMADNSFYSEFFGNNVETGEDVYVKMINPDKFTRYEVDKICFASECAQIKNFENPNLLKLYAAGSYSNTMCIVSEFVPGFKLLNTYLNETGLIGVKASLDIIQKLALGLRYAHGRNVIHRGIRASNIGIVENENKEITAIKLFDFGVSQIIDYTNTSSDQVDENFGFMAPETTGLLDHKVDARSDLYSLGILLYRFLTGHYPFHADTIDSMVYQHVAVMPKDPVEYNPSVTPAVSKMVSRLLAKDPDQRYQSANELINDIDVYFSSADTASTSDEETIIQTMERRSKVLSRKSELAQIRNMYTQALKSEGHFCLVQGPLGCGKSDLFSNLCNEFQESNIPFFRARFSSKRSGSPYYAFRDILLQYLNIYKSYEHKMASTERDRLFEALCGQSDLVFRFCPEMTSVLKKSEETTELDEFRDSQRTADRLSAFFLQLYEKGKPFVIMLDDLHNADAASLSLLREMVSVISNYKVFLVCSIRDNYDTGNELLSLFVNNAKSGNSYSSVITLDDFDLERMTEYVSDLLMINKNNCQTVASYLMDKTGGNSYFACNLLRSMLEDGVISISDGQIEENIDQFHMIDTEVNIFQVIEARLNKLSADTVNMLEVASVIGSEFSVQLLSAVIDKPKTTLSPLISEAVDNQLIEYSSSMDILCFSHRDIQSVVNNHLTDAQRRELHLKIAKGIELINPDLDKTVFELVYHYSKAESTADIKRYIMKAASKANETNAHDDALKYYAKALELIPYDESPADWMISKKAMVELNLISGHYDLAIEAAHDLLPLMTDKPAKAHLLHRIALGCYRQSKFSDCESYLIEALGEVGVHFPSSGKPLGFGQNMLSLKTFLLVHFKKDFSKLEPKHPNDPTADLIVAIYETLCWTYAYSNVNRFVYTALRLFSYAQKTFGASPQLAIAASAMSIYYMLKGDAKHCALMQGAASKLRNDYSVKYGQARSLLFSGFTAQTVSDLDKSIRLLKEASECFKAIGDQWEYNNSLIFSLYSLLMLGRYEDCITLGNESITISEKLGDRFSLAKVYAILVECYTQMGNYPQAESTAKLCKAITDELNFPYSTVCYNLAFGKLLYELGKFRESAELFREAKKLIDDNSLAMVHLAPVYPYLALSMVQELHNTKNSMSLGSIQDAQHDIRMICEDAENKCINIPNSRVTVKRAWSAYAIICNKLAIAEKEFVNGIELVSDINYNYECAMLEFEYGKYLHSKHRVNESRFQIFEAYMTFTNISSIYHAKECETIIDEKYHESFRDNSLMKSIAAQRNRMNVDRKANTLLRLGERLTSTLELDELQRKILQDAVEMVGAERGILFLYPETGDKVLYVASVYNLGNFDGNTYEWMLKEVEKSRKPIIINDMQSDEYRKHYSVMVRYGIKSVMAMPMFVRGNLFGIIYLDSRLVRQIFNDEYIEAMGFIANQAGAPIENARLYHKAITDGLTGIYGRSYLDNLIVDKTSEENPQVSAIMIDVDHFKNFNDTYGHQFGDKVLKQIAGVMKRVAGDLGVPCRYGGEEFVILMNSKDEELVMTTAEKVRTSVEASTLAYNEGTSVQLVSVTISLGVSIWDPSTMERLDLIEHADKALYFAKHNGRNQVKLWDESVG